MSNNSESSILKAAAAKAAEVSFVDAPSLIDEAFGKPPVSSVNPTSEASGLLSNYRFQVAENFANPELGSQVSGSIEQQLMAFGLNKHSSTAQINEAMAKELGLSPDASKEQMQQAAQRLQNEMNVALLGLPADASQSQIAAREAALSITDNLYSGMTKSEFNKTPLPRDVLKPLGLPANASNEEILKAAAQNIGLSSDASLSAVEKADRTLVNEGELKSIGLPNANPADFDQIFAKATEKLDKLYANIGIAGPPENPNP